MPERGGFASGVWEQTQTARAALAAALGAGDELAAAEMSSRLRYLLALAAEHGVAVPEGVGQRKVASGQVPGGEGPGWGPAVGGTNDMEGS